MGVYFSVALKVIDVLIFLVLMRGFITFFHEMGHATAYLFLTKNIVSVFLGTYGSREKSLRVLSGRLEIWIIRNPLKWKGGLCESYSSSLSTRGHLIGILAGPFASLLLALITYSIYLFAHPSGLWEPLMLIFAIASGLSFLYNRI